MSLTQQFLQQNLYRHLDRSNTENIQLSCQATSELLERIASVRQQPKLPIICAKIDRVSNFITLKEELLQFLQNDSKESLIMWIHQAAQDSLFLIELLRKQTHVVSRQINQIIKRIFLPQAVHSSQPGNTAFDQYLEDNRIAHLYLQNLRQLKQLIQASEKIPQRARLVRVDKLQSEFNQIFQKFIKQIELFNSEALKLVERLYSFQQDIFSQFREVFSSQSKQMRMPQQSRNQSFIQENPVTFRGSERGTPRKQLNTYEDEIEEKHTRPSSVYKNRNTESFLDTRMPTNEDSFLRVPSLRNYSRTATDKFYLPSPLRL